MTGATLARPPVRHQEDKLPMLDHLITPPVFGDPRLPARFIGTPEVSGIAESAISSLFASIVCG